MSAEFLLPAELTIYTAGETRSQCLAWLATAPSDHDHDGDGDDAALTLDASAVAEVDAAGVQLLLSLSNALARQQRRLRLVSPGAALVAACAALGVAALLDDAVPAGGAA